MISVLLPTIRPHLVQRAVRSVEAAVGSVPHEVIVVADFVNFTSRVLENSCAWIVRERNGVVDALNVAYARARGTHVFSFNDEAVLEARALEILYQESLKYPKHVLTPRHLPLFNFSYYGKNFAPFPFAPRALLDAIGGIADPAFRAFYSDPDLSMRAHARGVPVRVVDDAIIRHCNEHDLPHREAVSEYLVADREQFRQRWDYLGEFRDP